MDKYIVLTALFLVVSVAAAFGQATAVPEAESFEISEEMSAPLSFGGAQPGSDNAYYPEIIPSGNLPQSDVVGKPADYVTDYSVQYQQRDGVATGLIIGVGVCVAACLIYYVLYAASY